MNTIWVTFQKEGIHGYSAAGKEEELRDVDFLQYRHRHIFHVKVWLEISHDDRDVEFIQFKRWLESQYDSGTIHFDNKSCEMIANDLAELIRAKYPKRYIKISVSEDNENGAEMEYPWEGS